MLNRNERFFKKALKTLPKLQKNALIELSKGLIYEKYLLLNIIDLCPTAMCLYLDNNIVFENSLYTALSKDIPNLVLLDKTEIQSVQDLYKKDRIFNIIKKELDTYTIIYYIELTELLTEDTFTKTQKSLVALENLAAGISHEIKNPLAAIDIHTQLLQYQINNNKIIVPQEIKQYLSIVKQESDRLLKILDIFLNMTRKSIPELEFTEVSQVLETVKNLLNPELVQKGITLLLKKNVIPKIFTSPHILQQIILDLVRNSIEALEEVENKKIEISLKESNTKTHIIISIDDSGVGISPKLQYNIFVPYFTTKKTGTGLGLTLAKKMVRELEGEIFLKPSTLGGARFDISLPISKEHQKLLS